MKRRTFLRGTAASVAVSCMGPSNMLHALDAGPTDLNHCAVIVPSSPSKRETVAAEMVIDEIMKRCGISWVQGNNNAGTIKIYLGDAFQLARHRLFGVQRRRQSREAACGIVCHLLRRRWQQCMDCRLRKR